MEVAWVDGLYDLTRQNSPKPTFEIRREETSFGTHAALELAMVVRCSVLEQRQRRVRHGRHRLHDSVGHFKEAREDRLRHAAVRAAVEQVSRGRHRHSHLA